ncbi:MAG: hypothetical protein HUJ31_10090 [Pseudomonadales bacterium]|nr:hypothetical protein [Pseudomonadales bacterium]
MRSESLIALLLLAFVVTGCVRVDIGDRKDMPTLGEEMVDLYKAREAGAISESEYQVTRKQLLSIF